MALRQCLQHVVPAVVGFAQIAFWKKARRVHGPVDERQFRMDDQFGRFWHLQGAHAVAFAAGSPIGRGRKLARFRQRSGRAALRALPL